ncbi:GIY-YIG nuclease family protein [Paraflavitalea pollutisoli]|uniref:GIY-YIG nuclease family protein n=1 Tax=Paraflavitalea pollutisoli TaxID=3034143 RepID=UPI003B830839
MAHNEKFYVYVLQSLKDFSFYIGQCDDLDCRMSKHTDGLSQYTSGKGPWRLRYFECFKSRSEAILREKAIKKKKSRKYIEWLVSSRFEHAIVDFE